MDNDDFVRTILCTSLDSSSCFIVPTASPPYASMILSPPFLRTRRAVKIASSKNWTTLSGPAHRRRAMDGFSPLGSGKNKKNGRIGAKEMHSPKKLGFTIGKLHIRMPDAKAPITSELPTNPELVRHWPQGSFVGNQSSPTARVI